MLGRRRYAAEPVEGDPQGEAAPATRPATGARAASAAADGSLMLVRLIRIVAGVVTAIIALAIIFVVLDASTGNTIVSHIRDWARTLTTPFRDIFSLHSAKGTLALNYGIAIVVYWLVALLLERIIAALFEPARRRAVV